MEMLLILGLSCFMIFCVIVYFVILIFWPEWIGISGKKTRDENNRKRAESEQNQNS